MDRVEGDIIHSIHQRLVFCVRGLISAVTLERKVIPMTRSTSKDMSVPVHERSHVLSFSSTYLMSGKVDDAKKSPPTRHVLYCHATFNAADCKATTG